MGLNEKQRRAVFKKAKAVLADPEKNRREIVAAAKKENPKLTAEQIEAGEGLLDAVFGL
jgi:F0F1-type ATP synthase membrane subunit b/b'